MPHEQEPDNEEQIEALNIMGTAAAIALNHWKDLPDDEVRPVVVSLFADETFRVDDPGEK